MGIFDKRKSISREQLKSTLKGESGIIPKTGGRKYSGGERLEMSRKLFGPKYGSNIDKSDWRQRMRDLNSERIKTKTPEERTNITRQIDYLKKIGGKRV